jgi:hypothetical protein
VIGHDPARRTEAGVANCLLCQREAKLSREHALPSWVGRELNTSGTPVGHRYQGPPGSGIDRQWKAPRIDIKVKVVCEPCNNGPLSALENAAKTVLSPLIHRHGRLLIPSECKLVARWFLKTMLMLDLAGHPDHRLAHLEHEQWVRDQRLPDHVTLWLGAAQQPSGTTTAGRALDIQVGERSAAGWIFTMIIGHPDTGGRRRSTRRQRIRPDEPLVGRAEANLARTADDYALPAPREVETPSGSAHPRPGPAIHTSQAPPCVADVLDCIAAKGARVGVELQRTPVAGLLRRGSVIPS